MIRINLLPVRAAQKKEKFRTQLSVLILSFVLVGLACGVLYVQQQRTNENLQTEIADINRRNADLQKVIGEVRDYEKRKADLEQKLQVLAQLNQQKSGPVRLMDDLSDALPSELWLTSFSEQDGNIDLAGIADSEQTVALFMQQLEGSAHFESVELNVTEQMDFDNRRMQRFILKSRAVNPASN